MAMTLVSTVTVGSGGATFINFTNIPSTGKDLLLLLSARSTRTILDYFEIRLNSTDSFQRYLIGNGSTASSSTNASRFIGVIPASTYTSNTFGNASIYISNYASSSAKSLSLDAVSENNATESGQGISASSNATTSAITSISLNCNNDWAQHTSASLYIIS